MKFPDDLDKLKDKIQGILNPIASVEGFEGQ